MTATPEERYPLPKRSLLEHPLGFVPLLLLGILIGQCPQVRECAGVDDAAHGRKEGEP